MKPPEQTTPGQGKLIPFLAGMLVMAWNVIKTVAGGSAVEAPIPAAAPAHA